MKMSDIENKIQAIGFIVLFVLVIIGCLVGSFVMNNFSDSILGFNVPAVGILAVGEFIWMKVRDTFQKRWSNQEDQRKAE